MNPLDGLSNPFRHTIVADPWQSAGADVPEIHRRAFDVCRKALEDVRAEVKTRSVLLHGEPGSGKTHLLARLRAHWVGDPGREVDPIRPEVVFIAVRLQTGPQHLWRYLRRSMAADLLRTQADGLSQVERILLRRFAEIRPADADLRLWWEWLRQQHPDLADLEQTLDDLFDRLDPEAQLGRDLCRVLAHLLLGRHKLDAKAWLRGDPLPNAATEALGVAPPDDDHDPEEHARQAVLSLCRLAGPKIPVVFCFDQIEALQVDRADTAALFAFGQFVMDLFNATSNVLIISSVQIGFLDLLQGSVLRPAWDRMAVHQNTLAPLRWPEAERLIAARLDALPEVGSSRANHPDEPLWPLDPGRLKATIDPRGDSARRVLSAAAELFDGLSRLPSAPRPTADQFLGQDWQQRLDRAGREATAARADEILAHGLPLLAHLHEGSRGWQRVDEPKLQDIDVLWRKDEGRVGVSICNQDTARSLWRRFQRLPDHLRHGRLEKLVVVRDARLPIVRSAKKTHQFLDDLRREGGRVIRPSAEALAALDALRGLLSDAKAGDLAHRGEAVGPQTVEQWLAAHLPEALADLVDDIFRYPGIADPAESEADDRRDRLTTLLDDRPVLPLAEAAAALGLTTADLDRFVREHPEHFGYLGGPPAVIFRLAAEPAPAAAESS